MVANENSWVKLKVFHFRRKLIGQPGYDPHFTACGKDARVLFMAETNTDPEKTPCRTCIKALKKGDRVNTSAPIAKRRR